MRQAEIEAQLRGIDFNFGKEPANSFTSDQHPDLRADFVMATAQRASATSKRSLATEPAEKQDDPMPFNISEWWDAKLEGDARWRYGTPSKGNANFAWIQHMLNHLAPQGSMALLLANGSMSSGSGGEGEIRRALIEADLVECMVALPGQLFTNTQIPACIWFLFIDARKLGYMIDRVLRAFTAEDLEKIIGTFRTWKRSAADYRDVPGFCKSAPMERSPTRRLRRRGRRSLRSWMALKKG